MHPPLSPTSNPYLDEFDRVLRDNIRDTGSSGRTDGTKPDDRFWTRRALCGKYAWGIPNDAALSILADLAPIVEIGAGTGYWAALLRARGVHVEAIDNAVTVNEYHRDLVHWTQVAFGTPNALKWTPASTLFLCWPVTGLTAECLEVWRGRHVVLVADPVVGADAYAAIHDSGEWRDLGGTVLPRWPGWNDAMQSFERRS